MFLPRTSCYKITLTNGYHGAWPGRAVSVSVFPLTIGSTREFLCGEEQFCIWIVVVAYLTVLTFLNSFELHTYKW